MLPPQAIVLEAQSLVFSHSPAATPPLFDRLSFVIPPGVTWLGGDEGSGKTTLLQLLAGALPGSAVQGQLQLHGVRLAQDPAAYRRQVAWLDPRDDARDAQTARAIFAGMPAHHAGWNAAALQAHLVGLSLAPHLDKALYMMSSGTRRKVLIAAALAASAPLTLLDQPFMALDRPSIDYLLQVLQHASRNSDRAWVVADYEAPADVTLASVIALRA
ncbi:MULTISPECIES: ATP-binding cassette domain-containing protein [unclassified Polaromonas]|uniref:ABC transporter ATP-binding protein n=1 Tax=unclassified Polaromonas TaxID=2638319 RepID=UPI0018CAE2BF|nr:MULTISPECIES: ATP-binding cassette domain-containing protein [unclassified Polaromonas]MBG6071512.1 ABC-type multidrug transport system ATPase subunit [Polaromonas sp. CG_9.7]MBG6113513.1 ABC-type multidrug transport system ATPase subunit [Polaromonas sp. CG_9.2]MDH6183028.1 ABC-type multidrug transport system ATPase subunit [Polaromonas sp. CG_23.6]